jgi:two-component system OmpR family response regulator
VTAHAPIAHRGPTHPAPAGGAPRVLVIEDDASAADALLRGLTSAGFSVWHAATGDDGLALWRRHEPDAVVLDLILPDMDGLDVCLAMRGGASSHEMCATGAIPLIIASGRTTPADRVCGLELGADDYVCKPFAMAELVARLRALVARCRRYGGYAPVADEALEVGSLVIDPARHEVLLNDALIDLTPKEFDLLQALARSANRTVASRRLLWDVWGYDENIRTRTLDVHIGRLRRKLEADSRHPSLIVTVPSLGYRLQAPASIAERSAA